MILLDRILVERVEDDDRVQAINELRRHDVSRTARDHLMLRSLAGVIAEPEAGPVSTARDPRFEVMITMASEKFATEPRASVRRPASNTWRNVFQTR